VSKTLIFSDVHLKVTPGDLPRQLEFAAFLRQFRPPEFQRVICLGDLFDFWFEYRHVIFSGYFEVLRAFAELRDAGVELHLVCGNHDFWAGRFLREQLGFHIHQQAVVLPFGTRRVYLLHGDGVNPTDRGYRIYKRFARNPLVIGAFRLLHPDWAMRLAQGVSHGSRSMLQEANPAEGAEALALQDHAREILARGEADVVMCGHAHAPVEARFPTPKGEGVYFNTGDWLHHRTHVVWDGEEFVLFRAKPCLPSARTGPPAPSVDGMENSV